MQLSYKKIIFFKKTTEKAIKLYPEDTMKVRYVEFERDLL